MALCIGLPSTPTAASVAEAFAVHDMMLKSLAFVDTEGDDDVYAIPPGDDYYTTPCGIVKVTANMCYLVFRAYKVRDAHEDARGAIMPFGRHVHLLGSTCEARHGLGGKSKGVQFFYDQKLWDADVVCTKLEDFVFESACEFLGVPHLPDWREHRTEKVKEMCRQVNPKIAASPLATLPESGKTPFRK